MSAGSRLRTDLGLFLAVGLAYAAGSTATFEWFQASGVSAVFFPPAGVTLAALALTDKRRWPVILAAGASAEVIVDVSNDIDFHVSLGYAFANTCEPLTGATLLRLFVDRPDLSRTRDLRPYLACAVVAGPAVGGILGATNYVLQTDGTDSWLDFQTRFWVGDGLGVLAVGSAIIAVATAMRNGTLRATLTPGRLVLVLLAVAATGFVFWNEEIALAFVAAGLLAWVASTARTLGVALSGLGMAFVAAEATAEGHGFFEALNADPETAVLYQQLLLAFLLAGALALAAEIAQRERTMLEWGRSEEARRRSELVRAAEREAHGRTELLQRLADRMAAALTREEIARVVAEETIEHFSARSTMLVIANDSGEPVLAGAGGYTDEDLARVREGIEGGDELPLLEAFRSGEPCAFTTEREGLDRFAGIARLPLSYGAVLAMPLKADDRVVGALAWGFAHERSFDRRTRDLAEAIAAQSALALARAELTEVEHRFANEVQRMMLRPVVELPPGLDLAARYLPSESGLNVGGDWYDVERRSETEVCIAVGDLVGRGLPAAAAMGQLRSAANALTRTTSGPGELLGGLDRFVIGMASAEFSTACAARMHTDSGLLRFSSAGHLPPLLIANGSYRLLEAPSTGPLGFDPERPRAEAEVELPAGSLVALYTDGLVERRSRPIDKGIEFLGEVLSAGRERDRPLDALIDEALEYLVGERGAEDDIALIVLRYG